MVLCKGISSRRVHWRAAAAGRTGHLGTAPCTPGRAAPAAGTQPLRVHLCAQLDDKQRRSIAIKRFLACMPVHPSTMASNPKLWRLDSQRKGLIASGAPASPRTAM